MSEFLLKLRYKRKSNTKKITKLFERWKTKIIVLMGRESHCLNNCAIFIQVYLNIVKNFNKNASNFFFKLCFTSWFWTIWKNKEPWIVKILLKKKNRINNLVLQNIKIYYKAKTVKTKHHWFRASQVEQLIKL